MTVTDTLPVRLDLRLGQRLAGSCSQSAGTVTCALGTVANGGTASAEIKVRPNIEGSVTTGERHLQRQRPEPVEQLGQRDHDRGPGRHLELTKTDSPDPVLSGQQLTYDLTVHNAGPSSTSGVALSDTLPSNVTFISVTTTRGSCFRSGVTVLCSLGTFADEDIATIQIKVTTQAPALDSANVFDRTADPIRPTRRDPDTTVNRVGQPLADEVRSRPTPLSAGRCSPYSLGVHNAGPRARPG